MKFRNPGRTLAMIRPIASSMPEPRLKSEAFVFR